MRSSLIGFCSCCIVTARARYSRIAGTRQLVTPVLSRPQPFLPQLSRCGRSHEPFLVEKRVGVPFFGVELEVVPFLVDAPAIVCDHKVSVASIFNHLIIVPVAGFETDVSHPDYWELVVFGSHAPVTPGLAHSRGGFSRHEISHEFS